MFGVKTVVLIIMLGGVNSVAAVVVVVVVGVPDSIILRTVSLSVEFLMFPVELRSLEGVSNESRGILGYPFKRVWQCKTDFEELNAEDDIISRAVQRTCLFTLYI